MICPFCGSDDSKVIDVRTNKEGVRVRRRECQAEDCRERVTTYELTQVQITNALTGLVPTAVLNRIGLALAIALPETGENPDNIFDFYFEDVSDF